MKKTILATLITATSFASVAAADSEVPPMPVNPHNITADQAVELLNSDRMVDILGIDKSVEGHTVFTVVKDEDGNPTHIHVNNKKNPNLDGGASIPLDGSFDKMDKQQVETLKRHIKQGVQDNKEQRQQEIIDYVKSNNGDVIVEPAPVVPIGSIPVTREQAIDYVKNTDDLKNGANLDKAVMYRMNNENKYEFSGSEKLAAVNKITGKGFQVHYGLDGQSFLVDGEGNQYTPEQVKEMAIAARKQVQEEAQKRAEVPPVDGELPPVDDVAPLPEVGIDEERVKEAVQQLVESGSNLVEAGETAKAQGQAQAAQQQAQIDEIYAQGQQNTSDIATLFNEVDRLDTRIDQTQALNAATVNARPMVTNGDTAFGAGVGYAGSEAAISVGVAHSFVDTGWSASATLAASSDDVVIGAGTQYTF